jgi:hypothetical protein
VTAPDPRTETRHPWRPRHTAALAAIVLLALGHVAPFLGYLTDDTFIHLQFAKNLIGGRGFSFTPGEPTYGATSPLWVLLLAGLGRFVPGAGSTPDNVFRMPELAWTAKACGAVFLACSLLMLARLGRVLGWRPASALALAALLGAHAWSARWAISGMETPLAVFLVVLALGAVAKTLMEGRGGFAAGLFLGLAALARPECWLLAALAVGAFAITGEGRRGRRALAALAGVAATAGPWLVAAWLWFHRLLPNTSAAKAGAPFDPGLMLAAVRTSLRIVISTDAIPIGLAVVAFALAGPALARSLPRGRRAFWLVACAWPVLLVAGLAAGGVQVISRYLLPAVPSLLLLGVASLQWAMARLGAWGQRAAVIVLVALYAAPNAYLTLRYSVPHARRHTAGLRSSLATFGLWARAETPPGTLIAVPDIGAFGYYSDRPVLDLFGLVTPAMAPIAVREGYDTIVDRLLFERVGRPDYLIDRARDANRLAGTEDPANPYVFLTARSIPDLGITRPVRFVYSLYSIRWDIYDRMHPRLASLRH